MTFDSIIVDIRLVLGIDAIQFMCINSIIAGQMPCEQFNQGACRKYLEKRNNKNTKEAAVTSVQAKCRINSIEVGKSVAIRVKAVYYPDMLGQVGRLEKNPLNFLVEARNITFTPDVRVSFSDNLKYYRRPSCPQDRNSSATFIKADPPMEKDVPTWTYVVSVLAALFLLLCIVLILRKYGFFKKKEIKDISAPLTGHEIGDGDDDEEEDDEM